MSVDDEPIGFRWIDDGQIRFQAPALGREADRAIDVCHAGGCAEGTYASRPGRRFLRGDANADGRTDLGDPIAILLFVFGGHPIACADAADGNDDGRIDVSDAIWILSYLFADGPPPPPPTGPPGPDPPADALLCGV